jgi:hypothetical protein
MHSFGLEPMDESLSFSGHQSFPFRNTRLTKGVTHCHNDPTIFSRDDAIVTLGVGKNMVQSIRHWCLATKVIEEDPLIKNNRGRILRPTILGKKIFPVNGGWDPYLEDIGTLWLIHWLLVTNTDRATTWRFAFNSLHQSEFTKGGLERALASLTERSLNLRVPTDTLKRDIDVFVRSYVGTTSPSRQVLEDSLDCPLTELGLIVEQESYGIYAFVRGPKDSLPDAVLIFAMCDYIRRKPEQHTFTFDELAYGPLSPGRAFKLDESSLAERFDRLEDVTHGAWQFSETAGYRQVLVGQSINGIELLNEYYRRPAVEGAGAEQ